jgi:hypothetical protein
MSLGMRKLIVLSLVAAISLLANVWLIASWLEEHGVIDWACHIRHTYLTGTAITITIVLLILIARPTSGQAQWQRRCPVCEHPQHSHGPYCSACGCRRAG